MDGDDTPSALLELALRLIPDQRGPHDPADRTPRLWPGSLPDILPFELPLPPTAHLIGSYGRGLALTVLADVKLPTTAIVTFYTERLKDDGWTMPLDRQGRGGFVPPHLARWGHALFCRAVGGPALTLSTVEDDTTTHLTLSVNLDPADKSCRPPPEHQPEEFRVAPPLPPLMAPSCRAFTGGSFDSSSMSTTLARLETDAALRSVAEHYERQLTAAGWEQEGKGESGLVTWSVWTFTGWDRNPASGVLTVLREPGSDDGYVLYLNTRDNGGEHDGAS